MKFFMGNALWNLLAQSDGMTWFILFSLLITSIICWSIAFYKLVSLHEKSKQIKNIIQKLQSIKTFETLSTITNEFANTYSGILLVNNLHSVQRILQRKIITKKINIDELERLQNQSFNLVDEMVESENEYVSILAVVVPASPLMGLLGTVWGLMHSFLSISQKQSADIVTIAPGIAEALLTTLAGLMVAIPVLCLYQSVISSLRNIEYQLFKMVETMQQVMQHTLVEEREENEIATITNAKIQNKTTS